MEKDQFSALTPKPLTAQEKTRKRSFSFAGWLCGVKVTDCAIVDLSQFLPYIICIGFSYKDNHQELKEKTTISKIFGFALILVLCAVSEAVANGVLVQATEKGRIDWSARTASAQGTGAPETEPSDGLDAARLNAQANLMETVRGIRINANSRISGRMALNPDFLKGLKALIQNADITHQKYFSDGTAEVEITMKLSGGFAQFVLPKEIRQVDSITATSGVSQEEMPTGTKGERVPPFTGLIVDAVGIDAEPALVPLIIDEAGETVYGPAFVSREFAVSRGMSGFAATLEAAKMDKRVGENPMIVKAIRIHEPTGNTDLVISNTDAARLRSSAAYLNFLKACQVSIVLDLKTGS